MVSTAPLRGDVYLVQLDPVRGKEIRKTRPCVVISPDELNKHIGTYIVAPLTTGSHPYPFRVPCRFSGKDGYVVLDQMRTVDGSRFLARLGALSAPALRRALRQLQEMFRD